MTWIKEANQNHIADVAIQLGLAVRKNTAGPCPCCHAERRGSQDKRHPLGFRPDGRGWCCHRCGAKGDVVDLVARHVCRVPREQMQDEDWRQVLEWFGGSDWPPPHRLPQPVPRQVPPLSRPDGLQEFVTSLVPVSDDPEVSAWLSSRGLDPEFLYDRGVCWALPEGLELPRWARYRGHAWSLGWRCIFPVYGSTGQVESVRARWVKSEVPPTGNTHDKAGAAACGPGSATGMVLADALGQLMLKTSQVPEWWDDAQPFQVIVCEGETDFATWATRWGDAAERAPAILGLWSGAWTAEIADRIPTGSHVIIRTHHDRAGHAYAEKVAQSIQNRCTVFRSKEGNHA